MRTFVRGALALAFLAGAADVASAQVAVQEDNTNIGTASAEFLLFGAGARGMALGHSFSALVRDVEAVYYNPAGLPLMESSFQARATVMPYFADTDYYWLGLAFPFAANQFAIGVSLGNFGFSDQPVYTEADPEGASERTYGVNETFVSLSFAHAFIDRFTGGFTLKFISDQLGQADGQAFAVDIGTNFHTEFAGRPIAMAVVIQNLGSSITHSGTGLDFTSFPEGEEGTPVANVDESPARFRAQAFPLPTTFRVGVSYDVLSTAANRVSLLGEFNEQNNADPSWAFAGEYEWTQPDGGPISAALRGSYAFQPDNYLSDAEKAEIGARLADDNKGLDGLALGGGIKYRFSRYEGSLDYTYRHYGYLGSRNVFSLGFAVR